MTNESEDGKTSLMEAGGTSTAAAAASTTAAATSSRLPTNDILDERLIDAEYKIWKKNTPYLYDFVLTHSLEWPSLTCQWLPNIRTTKNNTTTIEHQLLLGTHTTADEQNHLMVATCLLPYDDRVVASPSTSSIVVENSTTTSTTTDTSTVPAATNKENGEATPGMAKTDKATSTTIASLRYDEDKQEVGGYGLAGTGVGKIEIKMKIPHEGEINRYVLSFSRHLYAYTLDPIACSSSNFLFVNSARYMPQNHFIVATRGPNPELYIWDVSKHPSFPTGKTTPSPQGVCIGHEQEGYAMAWSPHTAGILCSGSEDTTVKLWDVSASYQSGATPGTQITTQKTFSCHTAMVEDVAWHCKDTNMIGSVGDDQRICIWDTRTPEKPTHNVSDAHKSDINCIAFNPQMEYIFATGCAGMFYD
jgi:histone-binding protein RBBP4